MFSTCCKEPAEEYARLSGEPNHVTICSGCGQVCTTTEDQEEA